MEEAITPTAITAVRDAKAASAAAEVVVLQTVVAWAAEFRVDNSLVDETTFGANGILLGGVGCPLVSEFDVYDLAAGLRMTSDAGCNYVGKVLELRYRLPKTWERVLALEVPVWKAFKVCDDTNTQYDLMQLAQSAEPSRSQVRMLNGDSPGARSRILRSR